MSVPPKSEQPIRSTRHEKMASPASSAVLPDDRWLNFATQLFEQRALEERLVDMDAALRLAGEKRANRERRWLVFHQEILEQITTVEKRGRAFKKWTLFGKRAKSIALKRARAFEKLILFGQYAKFILGTHHSRSWRHFCRPVRQNQVVEGTFQFQ